MTKQETIQWFQDTFTSCYQKVAVLKDVPGSQVTVWAHNEMGKKILMRRCAGDFLVYNKLLSVIHRNLPQILEVYETPDGLMVLEEFVEGDLLSRLLMQNQLEAPARKEVALQLCDALSCVHQHQIIHRDLKPENIMMEANGNVRLLDFGAARYYRKYPLDDQDTTILGTVGYAAPEQFGFTQTDERSDIFSFGILLNIFFTGEHPSKQIAADKIGQVVRKCTKINPKERYASMIDVKRDLL